MRCPICDSERVVEIVYGMYGSDLLTAELEGRPKVGGCVIEGYKWFCNACHYKWPPGQTRENVYEAITLLRLSSGGLFGESQVVSIDFTTGTITWHYRDDALQVSSGERTLGSDFVHEIREELRSLKVFAWKRSYLSSLIGDSALWSVEITVSEQVIYKLGNNKYPRNWPALCGLISAWVGRQFGKVS